MMENGEVGRFATGLGLPKPDHPPWKMVDVFPDSLLGQQAWWAHLRELPRLLAKARGQWVAYRGDQVLS
jgi:hypothetical protein